LIPAVPDIVAAAFRLRRVSRLLSIDRSGVERLRTPRPAEETR
jgi:hypothetical protein